MHLSVIIPCYNVAGTLQECVKSVLVQLPKESEVLLVDDGSTDTTGLLAEQIAAEHVAVRVFHKSNGGPSSARNYGIAKACGDFLMFMDSDDELPASTISPALAFMQEHPEVDIAEFPIRVHYGHESEYLLDFPEKIWSSAREYWIKTEAWEHTYAWNKIYRKTFLGEVKFPEGRLFEDMWFYSELLSKEPKVATLSQGLYLYRWNEKGLTVNANAKDLEQLLEGQMRAARLMQTRLFSFHGWRLYRSMLYRQIDVYRETDKILLPYPFVRLICFLHKHLKKSASQ